MLAFLVHSARPHNKQKRFNGIGSACVRAVYIYIYIRASYQTTSIQLMMLYWTEMCAAQMFTTHSIVFSWYTWSKGTRHSFSSSAQQAGSFRVDFGRCVRYTTNYPYNTRSAQLILWFLCVCVCCVCCLHTTLFVLLNDNSTLSVRPDSSS